MSSPELIDERFDELVRELRSGRPAVPPELRVRVMAMGESAAAPRPRRLRRRTVWALAPLAAAGAVGAAVVIGIVTSGGKKEQVVLRGEAPASSGADFGRSTPSGSGSAAGVPVSPGRAQQYEAELTLRVRDLSGMTQRALRLTRSFGGYVRSVDYGSGAGAGRADLVVRVPVGRVQEALVRFSSLGEILSQRVSIRDLQPAIDRRFRRLQALRRQIAALQGQTSPEARAKLARLRRELVALEREQARALRRASFATVALGLTTRKPAAAPPHRPGRIERALDRAGAVLLRELAVVLYVLIVAGPFALIAAASIAGGRALRRRSLRRLLERS